MRALSGSAALACALVVCLSHSPARADAPHEVTFWCYASGTLGMTFRAIAEDFNATQSDYEVKVTSVPWNSRQKALCALAAGIPPDVLMLDGPSAPDWVARGALEDVSARVREEGWSESQFFSGPWRDTDFQGRTYIIPVYGDIRCLIYNRELFRKAGLDPDQPPRTWSELLDDTRTLTRADSAGRVTQLGFAADLDLVLLLGWQQGADLATSDGRRMTLDDAAYVKGLTFQDQIMNVPGRDEYLRFFSTSGATAEAQDAFYQGTVAMRLVTGFYLVRQRQFAPGLDARLAPFPMPDAGEEPVSWVSAFGLGLPRGCRNPEGAWAFIRYMVSEQAQVRIALEMGMMPVLRRAAMRPEVYDDPNRRILVDMADRCRVYPKVPVIMDTYNQMSRAAEAVLHGRKTPKDALLEAQANVQKALDAYLWQDTLPPFKWAWFLWPMGTIVIVGGVCVAVRGWAFVRQGTANQHRLVSGYGFASPWLIGFIVFVIGPIVISLVYSFCHYQVLTPPRWAGLDNYRRLFTDDPLFWKSLANTLFYTALAVPTGTVAALALAILLNQPLRGMRLFRTVFYLPTLVTGVAASMLWMWLLQPEGLLNAVLGAVGIAGPLWLGDEHWSKPSLVLMGLWGVGGSTLVFLAGLQGIPRQLYEAAELDGAGPMRRNLHVTLPLLSPTILFVLLVGVIGAMQVFTPAFVISGGMGGPLDSTLFYVFYLYRKGFEDFQMGYASAMAWLLFAMTLMLTMLLMRLSRRFVHY